MKDLIKEIDYIECVCGCDDHILRLELTDYLEDGWKPEERINLDVSVLFPHYRFFRRILQSLRYIFRFPRYYSGFYTTSISPKDALKIAKICNNYYMMVEECKCMDEHKKV